MSSSDSVDLTQDGGVLKKLITPGSGDEFPPKGSRVVCHYHGTLLDGTIFDSSVQRNDPFKFELGMGRVIKGWDIGIATMKKGEKSLFTIKPEYGYGDQAAGDKIPPKSTLLFEVELLSWEDRDDISKNRDGSIMKKVLVEGAGYQKPSDEAEVHITLTTKTKDGQILDQDKSISFTIGEDQVIPSLEECVLSMKENEKAQFTLSKGACPPKWTMDPLPSSDSSPVVLTSPPATTNQVTAEITVTKMVEAKSSYQMSNPEKIEAATLRKERGNRWFKLGKIYNAIKKYEKGLSFIEYTTSWPDDEKQKADAARLPILLNLSQCLLNTGRPLDAIEKCNKALDIDPNSVKGLWRRGVARTETLEWNLATDDFTHALQLDPNNKEIVVSFNALKRKIHEQDKREKALYSNMFSRLDALEEKEQKKKAEAPAQASTTTTAAATSAANETSSSAQNGHQHQHHHHQHEHQHGPGCNHHH